MARSRMQFQKWFSEPKFKARFGQKAQRNETLESLSQPSYCNHSEQVHSNFYLLALGLRSCDTQSVQDLVSAGQARVGVNHMRYRDSRPCGLLKQASTHGDKELHTCF